MTDLEEFTAFFKGKGVPSSFWPPPSVALDNEHDRELAGLGVCDAIFKFNDDGKFIGVYNYEMGAFIERIAPERE